MMDHRKVNYLLIATAVICSLGLLGSGFAANMLLGRKSAELSKLKAKTQVAEDLQLSLKKSKADIAKYSELNTIARTIVPQDKNQAQTIDEITKLANESGIKRLGSITFPASTLGGAGGAKAQKGLTQVLPSKTIPGVYVLPITIMQPATNSVSYTQFLTFLKKLENNRRTALISSINIQPDTNNPGSLSFTLIINEYIKP